MKIKYNEVSKEWEKLPDGSPDGIYINAQLYEILENIQAIRKKKWDCIFLIDGARRGGKSTLGLTCAKILQPDLSINNVAAGMEDAAQKIKDLPDGSVLLIDEGSLVFNSRESMKRENIWLSKVIDVCGQKQLVLIVILPSFFDLAKNIAVTHSRFLLHIYTDEQLNRGRFAYFGQKEKRMLYEHGKKNYGSYDYPTAYFTGTFTDYNPLGQEYLDLKKRSLLESLEVTEEKGTFTKLHKQRDVLINLLYSKRWMSQKEISDYLGVHGVRLDRTVISDICQKYNSESGGGAW